VSAEPFDEVIIATNRGTLFIRGGYGREELWLGLASGRSTGDPDIVIELTPLMRTRLIEVLTEMPTPPSEPCWFCSAELQYPTSVQGLLIIHANVKCQCGGISETCEDEDDDGNLVISMAPVRCSHEIDHDEYCAQCVALERSEA
jgi:hypothetical protein